MTESMGIYFKGQLVGLMPNCDCPGGYDDIDVKIKPVTILDRETVELIEDALDGCITMGVPEKDAKIQAALKAMRGEK
jgi:hypothetical protein